MAFNLFKRKQKKNKSSAGILPPQPKLEPLVKPNIPEVPKAPGTSIPEVPPLNPPISAPNETLSTPIQPSTQLPEIPPIKAPEIPPMPEQTNIQVPETNILNFSPMENPIPPMPQTPKINSPPVTPMGEGNPIIAPEGDAPFMTPLDNGDHKEFDAPIKEKVITPFSKEEKTNFVPRDEILADDELPEFPESEFVENVNEIPTPPAYFSKMGEIREDVEEDVGFPHRLLKKPIFVEVNDYRKIMEEIDSIKKDSKKSKDIIGSLDDLKNKTESKLKVWNKELEKIQRNLVFMDKVLFEESG
ncbi:hypothetical protein H8D83_01060 [Candidatus Woesearchaeota archaeon]|nr:hypothetical protein [Candidatus Woesearchaeota archaeon]MBL7050848.1 hypothetical protein [Candidatus Woesearchaeota archaeon]